MYSDVVIEHVDFYGSVHTRAQHAAQIELGGRRSPCVHVRAWAPYAGERGFTLQTE